MQSPVSRQAHCRDREAAGGRGHHGHATQAHASASIIPADLARVHLYLCHWSLPTCRDRCDSTCLCPRRVRSQTLVIKTSMRGYRGGQDAGSTNRSHRPEGERVTTLGRSRWGRRLRGRSEHQSHQQQRCVLGADRRQHHQFHGHLRRQRAELHDRQPVHHRTTDYIGLFAVTGTRSAIRNEQLRSVNVTGRRLRRALSGRNLGLLRLRRGRLGGGRGGARPLLGGSGTSRGSRRVGAPAGAVLPRGSGHERQAVLIVRASARGAPVAAALRPPARLLHAPSGDRASRFGHPGVASSS